MTNLPDGVDRATFIVVAAVAALIATALLVLAAWRGVIAIRKAHAWSTLLTVGAAAIATGVAVNGMWTVFGDTMRMPEAWRVGACAFLEIAMLASAIRARDSARRTGHVGPDGWAVWVIALISATLASSDSSGLAKGVRFVAPLIAAWLWDRDLAADRRAATSQGSVDWRFTPRRLAVAMRLADPVARDGSEIHSARLRARLTKVRIRLASLEAVPNPGWVIRLRVARANRALIRHGLGAVEHLGLGVESVAARQIQKTVSAVMGLKDATAPESVTAVSPWLVNRPAHRAPALALQVADGEPIGEPNGRASDGTVDRTSVAHGKGQTKASQRPARKAAPQVKADIPSGLTDSAVTVWSFMLGKGDVLRKDIVAKTGLPVSTVKTALDLLTKLGHTVSVSRGVYRSVDPDMNGQPVAVASDIASPSVSPSNVPSMGQPEG